MKRLKERLAASIVDASFDLNCIEVRGDGTRSIRKVREIASDELASVLASERTQIGSLHAEAHVPDDSMRSLVTAVQDELADFINPCSGLLGHAFPIERNQVTRNSGGANGVSHLEYESTPEDFAVSLVQAAAITGVDETTKRLEAWKREEPIHFTKSTVVNGVLLNGRYTPRPDIEIVSLPLTTDELPRLPNRDRTMPSDYLGRTLVSLKASACPALFRPKQDDEGATAVTKTTGDVGFDVLCYALSLHVNADVAWTVVWTEHDEAAAFCLRDSTIVGDGQFEHLHWRSEVRHLSGRETGKVSVERGKYVPVTTLDETQLLHLINGVQRCDKKLRIAVNRWKRSLRRDAQIVDRLIELRIALEALYLKDFTNEKSQEMRFRLALFGAWHLGESLAMRKEIRKVLRDAYDVASGAVHTGEAPAGAHEKLKKARNYCRDGILKLLDVGSPDDWGDLILGSAGQIE